MSEFSEVVFQPDLNLHAPMLVEASAGTGKTYNIQNIYLRLVLGGLKVQQILVVTFTNAATNELRERLRNVLIDCRNALAGTHTGPSPEQRVQQALDLARQTPENTPEELKRRIQLALMDFDSAAIFTIHGFCKRVLERYAFECGHDPDAELLPEQTHVIREVCQDWWRQHAYNQDTDLVPFVDPHELENLVAVIYKNPDAAVKGSALPDTGAFKELVAACQSVWDNIENLKGNIVWVGNGQLKRAKNAPVGLTPIIQVATAHAAAFSEWQSPLPTAPGNETNPLAAATAMVIQTVQNVPQVGDAKPFATSLKTIVSSALENMALSSKADAASQVAQNVRDRIQDLSALTYEAMLANVRTVLDDKESGPRLREVLRIEFKAALIDEFQDTDPVQYSIFQNIFSEMHPQPPPLVYVGDPKQAIYGFRGGDIFTYYAAKAKVPDACHHSLGKNYRSESNLVAAVNQLFADPNGAHTFLNANLPYAGDLQANDTGAEKALLANGQRDEAPLKIWRYSSENINRWAVDVAKETVRILSDPNLTIDGKPLNPSQIAVLTMTHWEAESVQNELVARGVNAVRQANGNVFDSDEASPLLLVMQAMLEPGRASILRGSLCTDLFPCTSLQVARFNSKEETPSEPGGEPHPSREPPPATLDVSCALTFTLEDWIDVFREAGQRWHARSFIEAFQFLSKRLGIRAHVAGRENGARRLANILHLVELTHQAARGQKLGPIALLRWYSCQLDAEQRDDAGEEDTCKTRLSDDNDAVRIMTLFKSKGLQFPIVFLPTLWRRKAEACWSNSVVIKYHDGNNLVLDLDKKSAKQLAERENHQENIRLAYVGLTRAINRVYLFEQDENNDADKYAVAHLLSRIPAPSQEIPALINGPIERRLAPEDLPNNPWVGIGNSTDPKSLTARDLVAAVDKEHGHASFSSLAPHEGSGKVPVINDGQDKDEVENQVAAPDIDTPRQPIFQIFGGAKLGTCWHEIFENIDFQAPSEIILRTVNDTLDKYRVCKTPSETMPKDKRDVLLAQRHAVPDMVEKVLRVPLDSGCGRLTLKEVPRISRRSELEFNFSLQQNVERLIGAAADILTEHWKSPGRNDGFIQSLKKKGTRIPRGFMTGFIDLIFEHGDRFYIVDWKSNWLSRKPEGFDPTGLADEMTRHSYYLQYLIYTVAVHGFLSRSLKRYDYDTHFGGVFYIFLRGVDGTTQNGVFTDRPSKALVEALSCFLGG